MACMGGAVSIRLRDMCRGCFEPKPVQPTGHSIQTVVSWLPVICQLYLFSSAQQLTMKTSHKSLRKKWYAAEDARSKSRVSMAELTISEA
jgi:hypothetical protein